MSESPMNEEEPRITSKCTVNTEESVHEGSRTVLSYYPLSFITLAVWVPHIAVMFWLLEKTASTASAEFPQSCFYKHLPDAIQIEFEECHAAITAMHLARLAVSALHNQRVSPTFWAEFFLFWLADRS